MGKILKNYVHIGSIRILRCINSIHCSEIKFHGFCDSSGKANAAALYVKVRERTSDGTSKLNVLVGKTKVAPVKTFSLPRLEICGALLLAELMTANRPIQL